MQDIKKIEKIWSKEAEQYKGSLDSQPDYIANYFHLRKNLNSLKNKEVLEVGSGTGMMSAYLGKLGANIHLVDVSKTALRFAKDYYRKQNIPVKLYNVDAFKMPFRSCSFDYVWNGGVVEHFNDEMKILMLKKMWKLVKPGGKLLVCVPNAADIPFMIAKKILEIRKKWAFGVEDDLTTRRMKNLVKRAGINSYNIYAYNPIVGYWFFPYGREIMDKLGLNSFKNHARKSLFGHVILLSATKPKR